MASKDNIYCDEDKRLIYFSSDIDNSSIGLACYDILSINEYDNARADELIDYQRKPIKIYINSGGGDIYDMWALIDIILNSKTPVYTYCTGYAMSAAFNIFLSGHKRFATKHATFMYHQLWNRYGGRYLDVIENTSEIDYLQKDMEKLVCERTKITQEKLDDIRNKKQDWFIRAEEALKYGIIDTIL